MSPVDRPVRRRRRRAGAAAALLLCALTGCPGGDTGPRCGAPDAGLPGLSLRAGSDQVRFGNFSASANNDCPPPGGAAVTSVTIDGVQTDPPASFHLTLCLPRPDRLTDGPLPLSDERVQLVNVNAQLPGGCTLLLDSAAAPDGTITFSGYCGNGTDRAGYAMALEATLEGKRTCPGSGETAVDIQLSGSTAVQAL
jgi:hypothetical protein